MSGETERFHADRSISVPSGTADRHGEFHRSEQLQRTRADFLVWVAIVLFDRMDVGYFSMSSYCISPQYTRREMLDIFRSRTLYLVYYEGVVKPMTR